jgi:hypothetical protein
MTTSTELPDRDNSWRSTEVSGIPGPDVAVVAVIGDVVGSRSHADRHALQVALREALTVASSSTEPMQPFQMTIGDEFQGVFQSIDDAIHATFLVQLQLVDTARVRFGIGVGTITVLTERGPFEQDGPAWWRARAAIEEVQEAEHSYGAPPRWATGIVSDDQDVGPVQAYLQLRDHLMADVDAVDADILYGLLRGRTQADISRSLGLDKGAVSRRVSRHGLSALLWSLREFRS